MVVRYGAFVAPHSLHQTRRFFAMLGYRQGEVSKSCALGFGHGMVTDGRGWRVTGPNGPMGRVAAQAFYQDF